MIQLSVAQYPALALITTFLPFTSTLIFRNLPSIVSFVGTNLVLASVRERSLDLLQKIVVIFKKLAPCFAGKLRERASVLPTAR